MVALGYPLPQRYGVTRRYGQLLIGLDPRPHTGIDLGAPGNTPVLAAAAGVARTWWNYGGGRMVAIAHGGEVETRYAHLMRALVQNGDRVVAGQQIGLVGSTGALVTGAHLHYEVHVNGKTVDPAPLLGGADAVTAKSASGPPTVPLRDDGSCQAGYTKGTVMPFGEVCIREDARGEPLAGQLFNLALPPLLEPALNVAIVVGGVLLVWRGVMTMIKP